MNRLTLIEIASLSVLLLFLMIVRSAAADANHEEDLEPIRIATLLPFVEDALALAPEQAIVVASVRRSMREPLASGLIDLGNPHAPNFERLAEARPQIIVGDKQIHAAIASRLGALGAKVLLIDTSGIDSTLESLSLLSRGIGESPILDARIAAVREEIGQMKLRHSVKVLPLFGAPGSFYAITERAWLGQLISRLGFENLAPSQGDERFPGLVVVSDEVMSMLEPDLVLLVAHGDPVKIRADLERRTLEGGAWSSLRNASYGIQILDPDLFAANPGLDLDRAARELVALAQPNGTSAAKRLEPVSSERTPR